MAHSGMRKYKRVSNSAPILVQCNVFLEDTHSHTRRVVEMKTLDQHFHSFPVSTSCLQQSWKEN